MQRAPTWRGAPHRPGTRSSLARRGAVEYASGARGGASVTTLSITDAHGTRVEKIGAVVLVGRHWTCSVRVDAPGMPLHWVELRWRGDGWAWRVLAAEDDTRGTGDVLDGPWRALLPGGGRVRLGADASIALVEGGPPVLHAVDLIDGRVHEGADLAALLDLRVDGARTLESDEHEARRLEDGDVFVQEGRPYRLVGDARATDTVRSRVQVRHPRLRCDVDLAGEAATFTLGPRSATVRCAAVRVLAVYVQARISEPEDGGWRTAEAAWRAWVALGGPASSSPERLGWEKGRLRSAITRAGLVEATGLFETRRRDGVVVSRVALPPERLGVAIADD
jgi:hypothetical protein